ncbi:MAG: hypothetical protein ACREJG_09735 [Candidatus Rokuibacteriota bacterium]
MRNFFVAILVVAILYGIYTVGVLGYEWFQVSSVVDDVVESALPRLADRREGRDTTGELMLVRNGVVARMHQIGVGVDERAVDIWEENGLVEVRVNWDFPVLMLQDRHLTVPLSVERSFNPIRVLRR